ncbi:MAG: methyl-accepting chemotaxis protein [Oscillospiraceae bacterium]|nr:methyl-accepting chemotaxis protein [Oscillospiraceae bacterium]
MLKSLKSKIAIPNIGIFMLIIVSIVVYVTLTTADLVENFDEDRMAAATQSVQAYLRAHEQKTLIAATAMGGSSELVRLINEGDREAVWRFLFDIKSVMGVDEIIVANAEGITIARSHLRDSFGDDVSGVPSVAAGLRGEVLQLYTPTPTAYMVMTTASPIMDGDQLVGSVVVNFVVGSSEFLDGVRDSFGVDATVFAGDTSVASTLIHPDTGNRAVGTPVAQHVADAVLGRREHLAVELNIFGRLPYLAYYFPLIGADGRTPVGMFFVGISQGYADAITSAQQRNMIIIGAVGLVVVVLIVLYIANMISKPLGIYEGWMITTAVEGNTMRSAAERAELDKYASRSDEIGMLFGSYSKLIDVFEKLEKEIEEIAGGNLDLEVDLRSDQDTISKTLQKMVDNLNQMFKEINLTSTQVATGSKQIADGSQALAQGSTEQAASVQQLSSSISEIAQKTKDNADKAERAALLANEIKTNAEKGSKQMDEMMAAVKDINVSSQSIGKVIKSIDDIAFQTNILALNAAVEAARAGQHGKGFAVVAEEVRNLAAKSAEAAKNTESLIVDSIEKAELGSRIADDTAASLVEIVAGIGESNQLVNEIAKSSEEQSAGIMQINMGVDQVAQVIQQNSATAEQSAAASQEMSGQSTILEGLVSQFRLKNTSGLGKSLDSQRLPSPAQGKNHAQSGSGREFGKY